MNRQRQLDLIVNAMETAWQFGSSAYAAAEKTAEEEGFPLTGTLWRDALDRLHSRIHARAVR